MMLRKTFTCSELCRRWNINGRDLTDIVNDGKLKPSNDIYLLIRQNANGYIYKSVDGRAAISSPGPLTVNEENGFYFNISDVEEFERENGITPHALPTDPSQQSLTKNPLDDHAQEKIGEDKIIPTLPPQAANFFTRVNHGNWHIGFDGKEAPIQHLLGLQYIGYLLAKPGKSISCRELYQAASGETPDKAMSESAAISEGLNIGGKRQAASDYIAKQSYLEKYQKLGIDLDNVEDNPEGEILKKEIEKEMAEIAPFLTERALPDRNRARCQTFLLHQFAGSSL